MAGRPTPAKPTANMPRTPNIGSLEQYLTEMKNNGRAESTRRRVGQALYQIGHICDLDNPEQVKAYLSDAKWENTTKATIADAYNVYLQFIGKTWKRPQYQIVDKVIYIPPETELDQLIASASKTVAPLLQLLKDTGTRIGEALAIQWTDIDLEKKLISINHPEKGSLARIVPFSDKCKLMLSLLPKTDKPVFLYQTDKHGIKNSFEYTRKRVYDKTKNPNILKIHFHTFRHYKATKTFEDYGDSLYVRALLGHKTSKMTDRYIHMAKTLSFDAGQWTSLVTRTIEEEQRAIEKGFTLVRSINETTALYKKRK